MLIVGSAKLRGKVRRAQLRRLVTWLTAIPSNTGAADSRIQSARRKCLKARLSKDELEADLATTRVTGLAGARTQGREGRQPLQLLLQEPFLTEQAVATDNAVQS
jgi:hypothetical protein